MLLKMEKDVNACVLEFLSEQRTDQLVELGFGQGATLNQFDEVLIAIGLR